jgi:hypothetical protein
MDGRTTVAKLRARVLWLAAKNRWLRGSKARIKRTDLLAWCELPDTATMDDEHGGFQAVLALLPADARPAWDGNVLTLHDPDNARAAVDPEQVATAVEYWRARTGRHPATQLTPARLEVARARLAEGWTLEQLQVAVDRMMQSEFHVQGRYTEVYHAWRVDRLERWLAAPDTSPGTEAERVLAETIKRRKV